MADKPFIISQPIAPIGRLATAKTPTAPATTAFDQILEKELSKSAELKFSRHAKERLEARDIRISKEQFSRLNEAVVIAQNKGCRDSLVLVDDLAFVVSIKNKTVITAVDGNNRKENVFTNIDSAVIN